MFKKYMCLALCLLLALGTMSTTASAASSADALVASYVSFSDSTGVISDLPENESTITASVTVSNNSSKASSVVLWVGKFVDDVLTDVTYVEHPLAGNEQGAVVTASLDGIKKDLAAASDGTAYDRTVVKAFVWSAMVGGKALAPVASLPSDNVDVLAVKKDGEIWKDFDPAVTEYDLTLQATDPYPEFEFVLADNSTRVEMPDAFAFGKNTVKVISAAGTEKDYTINLIDGSLSEGSLLFDDFESYGGTMDTHIWTNASGYLKNMTLVQESGNSYVSLFGTSEQQWPRLDKVVSGIDYKNPLEISGRGMLQGVGDAVPSFTLEVRRSAQVKETALEVSKSTIKVFGQVIGGGVEPGTWFSYKLILEKPVDSSVVTASVVITGDGLKDTSGQKVTSLSGSGSKDLAKLDLKNDIPLMFNCGGLDAEGKLNVNMDDIKVAYATVLSNDTTLGSLKYTVDGVTRDVTDFVPGVAADYRIYVPEGTTSVTLKPVPNIARAAKAEVYVGGALSADGVVTIAGDETEAVIKVTAEDGMTTAEHKVTIIIGEEGVSTNTNLASLTYAIGDGEPTTVPGFEPSDATDEDRAYNVLLPLGTASVTLGVTPINEKATYQIFYADGNEIVDGVVDLAKGTSVKIVVTPEDAGAAKGTYTIDFAIDKGMYVLDESNGAVQSDKSGIEFKTAVLESGNATYDYADGFTMNGVGVSANRNSEYVLNGEGKNLGYTWTLSSDKYAPGTYSVYVKGTGYGSGSKDSFYFVYDEAACSPDGGLMFLSPSPKDEPVAEHNMVALNWVKGDKTITIPENGSAKLRILGRENGAFVDKVMLINSAVTKTIEEAEAEMCPAYDAVFTSESGETLATVKYGSDVVGTAVPTEGTYLNGESIPETGTINALVVPEKEGFTGSWSPETLQENGTTFVPSYSSGEENQILELTESVPPSDAKFAMKAETIVFGTTSPYLLYSVGEENNKDGSNTGASIYGAQKAPAFFEGATAIRRDKNDSAGSNNVSAPTAKWWGNPAYNGKDGNNYYVTFKVSSDATVYVVDREGKGWPNKPDGWETSKYKWENKAAMFYKTFKAGELVQLPNYGWDTSWTDKTTGKAIYDPSPYVVVWGECPETSEPEPADTTIFSDDFEGYTVDTPIDNGVKGWDAINDNKASFIAVANPAGGQMAQVKALTKMVEGVDKGQKYPSMHKNANQLKETLDATGMEAIAISGKVQIHNTADTKPSHYIELRNTKNNDTSKRLTTLSITTDNIKFFDTKEAPNVIGSAAPDTWIDYTLYIKPGALDAETQFTVVLTGEGLKDANGTPTDRIVATKSQVYNVMAEDNGLRVVYNHAIPRDDGSYVYLDDLKIFTANVPEIEPEPEENAKLSALTYAPNGENPQAVPGFSAADEGKPEGYAPIELPYGTTSVIVGATRADNNASVTISPENPITVSSAAPTEVTVTVTNGKTTNTFKLTFTVAAEEPQPTEEIFSDDFEAYGLNASIDKNTKGWGAVITADNFTAVANPAGEGQVGEVKAAAERYPSLRKDVSMQGGETYLFSGKARLHDSEAIKPQHYLEFRPSGTAIKQVLLRIATQGITLAGDDNNIIGYASPDAWVSYKLYVTPGQAQTTFVAELTGEGLKDANNQPTDKILAGGKLDLTDFVPASGEKNVLVILNHNLNGSVDDARVYLDDIVISKGAAAPALSANTNLASLKYTPNGGTTQTDVPGFAADKAAYDVELQKGTTGVTIAAATEDTNARTIVMVGEEVKADKFVPVSADTATEAIVRVLAQDGTTKDITITFTVSDEEPVEPTEVISNLTYATKDIPTLAQIELGVTESYTNAGGCQVGAASSQEFAGAYVLQRDKGGDTSAPNNEEPYFVGKFDGQGGNPYWMTFTMNVPGTVYVVDMEGKGWPNKGDWAVDTSGLSFKIWDNYYNGNTGKLYSKHYGAGDTVQVPNYGWNSSWEDGSKPDGRYFTNPSIYLIVPDSNLEKNASLKSLTYTVGDDEAKTVGEFISGIVPAEALKVGVESATGVKIAAEPIANSGATVTFGGAASADGTVTFTGTTAEVTITVTSKDTTKTNTYTINFTVDESGMVGATTYDVPGHDGTTIDILVNPDIVAAGNRGNSGNKEIKPVGPIDNLSPIYSDRGSVEGNKPGISFIDLGSKLMGATQIINPLSDARASNEELKALIQGDNEYFRFRASEDGVVYVKFVRDIASYEADGSWGKITDPGFSPAMSEWGANGIPEDYPHNYDKYPYYFNLYQNATSDKPTPHNYSTKYPVTYYKTFKAGDIVVIRTTNSTENQSLVTLIQWGSDVGPVEPSEVLFEDNFESYGDATYPDNSIWGNATGYKDNLRLVKEADNTYVSIFGTAGQRWPRLDKSHVAIDATKTLHFSGRIMVQDDTSSPNATIEIRRADNDKNFAASLLTLNTKEIKIAGGPSIGSLTSGSWVNYDVYLTIGNETDAKVVAVLSGEGLKDASGAPAERLRGQNAIDLVNGKDLEILDRNEIAILLNTAFGNPPGNSSVNVDDYKLAYGEAPIIPDANLKSLTYNGVSVPNFAAATTSYTITMPTADTVAIAAEANAAGADVNIDKASLTPSAEGDTATITVTNSGETKKYTVTVKLDATANKVLNLSSASKADVQDNLVLGTGNNDGSLAYNDRDNVYYTNATSKFFEGATYIRPAKNDGAGVYSTLPYFSDKYNGKDGNPYWLEFVVSSDCRIFFADTYYNADKKTPTIAEQAKPWPNMPEGWTVAAPTDDVDIMGTHFWAATENGSVYYKDFKAGDVVQIPNYGAPSYWAADRQPYDPPVYLIVWGSDVQNPGIDDGGEPGGEGGGTEDGGETR